MKTNPPPSNSEASRPPAKKRWEEPAIVLERSLFATAQGDPDDLLPFLGPLGVSGSAGSCT